MVFDHFPPIRFKIRQQIRNPREFLRRYVCTTFYFVMPRNPKIWPKMVKNKLKMAKIGPKYRFFPMKFVSACPAQRKRIVNFIRDQNHELWRISRSNTSATLSAGQAGMVCISWLSLNFSQWPGVIKFSWLKIGFIFLPFLWFLLTKFFTNLEEMTLDCLC